MIRPLVLTLPVVVAATAAGQTVPAGSPTGVSDALGVVGHERPDAASGPTRVTIGLYVVDISRIDDVALTATVDFHLRLKWTDPRLASEVGGTRVLDADDVWTPVAQVANERRLFETFSEVVRVDSAGQATYRQRFHGTITTPLDLRNFPLDRNTVRFRVVAAGYGPGEVEFVVDDHITGQHRPLSIIDFRVADGRARLGTYELQPGGDRYSEFEYALEVSRAQAYFIWKVIVPRADAHCLSVSARRPRAPDLLPDAAGHLHSRHHDSRLPGPGRGRCEREPGGAGEGGREPSNRSVVAFAVPGRFRDRHRVGFLAVGREEQALDIAGGIGVVAGGGLRHRPGDCGGEIRLRPRYPDAGTA
ncbi:MAG: hypothetical protein ACYTAQ_07830 [Planctomycetota bacterium]|jgi:hypothetical protein